MLAKVRNRYVDCDDMLSLLSRRTVLLGVWDGIVRCGNGANDLIHYL